MFAWKKSFTYTYDAYVSLQLNIMQSQEDAAWKTWKRRRRKFVRSGKRRSDIGRYSNSYILRRRRSMIRWSDNIVFTLEIALTQADVTRQQHCRHKHTHTRARVEWTMRKCKDTEKCRSIKHFMPVRSFAHFSMPHLATPRHASHLTHAHTTRALLFLDLLWYVCNVLATSVLSTLRYICGKYVNVTRGKCVVILALIETTKQT